MPQILGGLETLKVEAECAACILFRASAQITEATSNPAVRFRSIQEIIRLLVKEFRPTAVPANLGTKRDRIIKRVTGNNDPYDRVKRTSNQRALKLLPHARKFVEEGYAQHDRFKRACLAAIVGNIIEFDIPGHRASFSTLSRSLRQAVEDLTIDDTRDAYELAKKSRTILYLTDNAGEIVFDVLLVEQLKNMGLHVTVAVKGGPILNDATIEDAEASRISKAADRITTTGTDAVGLALGETSWEFREIYDSTDLVFAKGMGYAETLTEYKLKKPHFLLLRTKCNPVANYFGVGKEKNIAKLMR